MNRPRNGANAVFLCLAGLAAMGLMPRAAGAAAPRTMSYQGVLTDVAGAIVPDGVYELDFLLYDVSTGGAPLWSETQPGVAISGGLLTVTLGAMVPLDLPFDQPYWLGVSVNGEIELSPRMALSAAPYALSVINQPGIAQVRRVGTSSILGNQNVLVRELILTITIPGPGYISLEASGMVGINGAVGEQSVIYGIAETSALTFPPETGDFYYCGFGTAPNANYIDLPLSCRRIYYKGSAGSYTFTLGTGRLGSFNANTLTFNPSLTAIYYPTSYGPVLAVVEHPDQASTGASGPALTADPAGQATEPAASLVDLRELEQRGVQR